MTRKSAQFIIILGTTLSISAAVLGIQFYYFLHNPLQIRKEEGEIFVLRPGTSVPKLAKELYKADLLQSPTWFLLGVYQEKAWNKLKAGEYLIKPGSTPIDLIHQLRDGRVIQHALTIVPGWNFERLLMEVNQSPHLTHTLTGLDYRDIMMKLGHPEEHPEGQFLPETYYFPAGTTDVVFLQRAYKLLHKQLAALWHEPREGEENLPLKSPYKALILASIIEKETSVPEEYTEIAGVYIRRLIKRMPLQADPTVIYDAGKDYKGNVTAKMLNDPTPYNTYRVIGLPPTPIALPSQKALSAALHPKPGDALYFVAKGDGKGHVFSRTLEEHQIAVNHYRKTLLGVE